MKAVIMCAGKGVRLKPLTDDKPKAMVPILGVPIVSWTIKSLHECGIKDIIIVYGYKGEVIEEVFGKSEGITLVKQEDQEGTAHAVSLVEELVDDNFLVLAGDTIYFAEHIEDLMNKVNSILYTSHFSKLKEFGTIEFDKYGDIVCIHEKKTDPVSNKVNVSGYHLTKDIFKYIEKTPLTHNEYILTETINMMIKDKIRFTGTEIKDWNHISYMSDLERIEDNFWRRVTYGKR